MDTTHAQLTCQAVSLFICRYSGLTFALTCLTWESSHQENMTSGPPQVFFSSRYLSTLCQRIMLTHPICALTENFNYTLCASVIISFLYIWHLVVLALSMALTYITFSFNVYFLHSHFSVRWYVCRVINMGGGKWEALTFCVLSQCRKETWRTETWLSAKSWTI